MSTRQPQDAVVANVKRLRTEHRAYVKQTNRRIRVIETDIRWLLRQWERWMATAQREHARG